MAEPPELDALASRYLDFWQEQAAAMTANPALADLVSKLFGAFGPGAAAAFASPSTDRNEHSTTDAKRGGDRAAGETAGPDGTTAAGASSVADDDRLDELLRRLADIEKRLAALEAGGTKPGS